jgi:hypothetical protein
LQYYYESGKLKKEVYDKIKEMNKYHVPFARLFEEYESTGNLISLSSLLKDTSPSPIKPIKGSDRSILSPFGTMIKNTYDILVASDRNIALKTVVESLKAIDKTLVQEIPEKLLVPVRTIDDLEKVRWTWKYDKPRNKNFEIITAWENGTKTFYEIPKEYHKAFFAISEPVSKFVKIASMPAQWLRAGAVVYDPTFAVRNVPRDQISAVFYSKYGYNPFYFFKGISEVLKHTETYQKFLASGADQAYLTAVDREMSKNYIQKRAGKRILTKWQEISRNPLILLQELNRASEIGTRIGAFKNAYSKTNDVYLAMQEAREIAGDYSIKGNAMKNVNPLYPFLNARIQHAKLLAQTAKQRPGHFMAKGLLYITAPSVIIWLFNHQDEKIGKLYSELPAWRRIAMFNIHIPGTNSFIPIPRGPLGILFGSPAEYFLDHLMKNDPLALKDIASNLLKDYVPISNISELVPQFGRPLIEETFNKIGYTNKPIVPERLKNLSPEEQYTDYTPEIIKKLGSTLGISPLRIQHLITSYTGGMGKNIIYMTDEILQQIGWVEKKQEDIFTKLGKLPITKALFTETPLGKRSRSVQEFYKILDEMQEINTTVNKLIVEEDTTKLTNLFANSKKNKLYKYYNDKDNKAAINKLNLILRLSWDIITEIKEDSSIINKREKIEELELKITNIAYNFRQAFEKGQQFKESDILKELYSLAKTKKRKRDTKEIKKRNLYKIKLGVLK